MVPRTIIIFASHFQPFYCFSFCFFLFLCRFALHWWISQWRYLQQIENWKTEKKKEKTTLKRRRERRFGFDPVLLRRLHLHCTAARITYRIFRSGCYILDQLRATISTGTFAAFAGAGDASGGGDCGNLAEKLLRSSTDLSSLASSSKFKA